MYDVYQVKRLVCCFCHHQWHEEIELLGGSFVAVVACPHCCRIVDAIICEDKDRPDV